MTICHKFDEAITMKSQNQSFIANRPSFMITDILSKAAVDKPVNMQEHSEHLKHLERFSAFSDGRLALHHGFGMMTHPSQGKPTFYDSEDDFHGSDDVDGGSSDDGKDDDDTNEPNQGSSPSQRMPHKKQRKARTAFTDHQLHSMEKCFSRQKYLSVQDRMELANKLGISDTQVKTWFQNRRTKWKRQTAVGLELFVEAGNYAAYQRAYASRYGQLDGMPYPANPFAAAHSMLPPSGAQSSDAYYQQLLQNSMASMSSPYANMFGGAHRPLPLAHPMPTSAGFMPLNPLNNYYPPSSLSSNSTSLQQRLSPEHLRSNSLSPVESSTSSSHSPNSENVPKPQKPSSAPAKTTTTVVSDDDSDIEV